MNTFTNNTAAAHGGAVCCDTYCLPTITDNTFTGNTGGGGGVAYCWFYSSPTIEGNTMTDNSAGEGGAFYCDYNSSPEIEGNTITGSSASEHGGLLYCYDWSQPKFINNVVSSSSTGNDGGAFYCDAASPTVTNNTIAGSSAVGNGGAFYFNESSATITNNTITGSSAVNGGGIYCHDSTPTVSNNIVTGNEASQHGAGIYKTGSGTPSLSHNDVWDNTVDDYYGCSAGTGDISADPEFVGAGDYHLTAGSPCIDAGDNAAIEPLGINVDLGGAPRIVDGNVDGTILVDIGAYEFQPENTTPPAGWFNPGWVWFSIPLTPLSGYEGANDVLSPHNCNNNLYGWDDQAKNVLLCPDDFTDLCVGRSYLMFLWNGFTPNYEGTDPGRPFVWTVRPGWCWVGCPGLQPITGAHITVTRNSTIRTGVEDYQAAQPWLNWNWNYWDPYADTAKIMSPYGQGVDDNRLRPWYGYRVWGNGINGDYTTPVTITFWPD